MPDAPPTPTPPAPPPAPKRVRRWPTAVLTLLLTATAVLLLARYVLPTQAWWVRKDPESFKGARERGAYIESVLFSSLSDEAKVDLISEAASHADKMERRRESAEPGGWDQHENAGRVRYLGGPLVELAVGVLSNLNARPGSQLNALRLFNTVVGWMRSPVAGGLGSSVPYDLRKAAPHLVRHLARPGVSVQHRREAARAFAGLGAPLYSQAQPENDQVFPVDALLACLADDDDITRWYAARALAYTPPHKAPYDVDRVLAALVKQFEEEGKRVPRTDFETSEWRYRLGESEFGNTDYNMTPLDRDTVSYWAERAVVRLEVVHSIAYLLAHGFDLQGSDPRSGLIGYLNTPREPAPDKPAEDKTWRADQFLRTEIILALRVRPNAEADRAVLATLRGWKPEATRYDFVALAAAIYLGDRADLPDAGPTLRAAFREEWEALRNRPDDSARRYYTRGDREKHLVLYTFAAALSRGHQATARTAVSELVGILPAFKERNVLCVPFHFYVSPLPTTNRGRDIFPHLRLAWWMSNDRGQGLWGQPEIWMANGSWLTYALEKLGPPAKSNLAALRKLLDYDGNGITERKLNSYDPDGVTDDTKAVAEVRREAAKALLRDVTAGVADPRTALQAVRDDPTSHPELVAAAKAALENWKGT